MDCRYPLDRDVTPTIIPSDWVPALPAGTAGKILPNSVVAQIEPLGERKSGFCDHVLPDYAASGSIRATDSPNRAER